MFIIILKVQKYKCENTHCQFRMFYFSLYICQNDIIILEEQKYNCENKGKADRPTDVKLINRVKQFSLVARLSRIPRGPFWQGKLSL